MSCFATVIQACENLQEDLNKYFLTCNAANLREASPFYDFLMSDMNNTGLSQTVNPGDGKTRTLNLRYEKRIPESEVLENQTHPVCVASTKRGNCLATYEMDVTENVQVDELISLTDLVTACESNELIVAKKMQKLIDALFRKSATKITEQAAAEMGRWNTNVLGVNGSQQLEVRTLRAAPNADEMAPFAMEDIDLALKITNYCAPAPIFAGQLLYKYYRRMQAGCCSNQGIDLSAILNQYGTAVMYDKRVAAAAGGNEFAWVLQPGALAILNFNFYEGMEGLNKVTESGKDYVRMVIRDPQSGLPIDLMIKDNCGDLSIVMTATQKLVSLPNDLWPNSDEQFGVKFFNEIKVVNS